MTNQQQNYSIDDVSKQSLMEKINSDIIDDISYWWVDITTHCETYAVSNKDTSGTRSCYRSAFIMTQASIRGYIKFAFQVYINFTQRSSTTNLNPSLSQLSFAETFVITRNDSHDDKLQLVRLYKKLQVQFHKQYLIREIVATTLRINGGKEIKNQFFIDSAMELNFLIPLFHQIIFMTSPTAGSMPSNQLDTTTTNLSLFLSLILRNTVVQIPNYNEGQIEYNKLEHTTVYGTICPTIIPSDICMMTFNQIRFNCDDHSSL